MRSVTCIFFLCIASRGRGMTAVRCGEVPEDVEVASVTLAPAGPGRASRSGDRRLQRPEEDGRRGAVHGGLVRRVVAPVVVVDRPRVLEGGERIGLADGDALQVPEDRLGHRAVDETATHRTL